MRGAPIESYLTDHFPHSTFKAGCSLACLCGGSNSLQQHVSLFKCCSANVGPYPHHHHHHRLCLFLSPPSITNSLIHRHLQPNQYHRSALTVTPVAP